MAKRVVAIVKQDPELVKQMEEIKNIAEHLDQRAEFLKKQLKDLEAEGNEKVRPIIFKMEKYLLDKGNLPADFDREKGWHTHYDEDLGVITTCDDDHNGKRRLNEALEGLLRGL